MYKTKFLLAALTLCAAIIFSNCSKKGDSSPSVPIPVADFMFSGNGTAPSTVTFTNTSAPISSNLTYKWDFGDGSATSTLDNPTHTYTQGGTYLVKLTATNTAGSNTYTKTVTILTPVLVKIISVKVTAMPFIDPGCSCGWDTGSGPDVFFTLTDVSNTVLVTGNQFTDVASTALPLMWNFATPYLISNFTSTYKIYIYDKDTNDVPPSPDDLIGGYSFNFAGYAAQGYPSTITLQTAGSPLAVVLSVQWQ